MFDSIGWGEIVVLALAALFIFGPERLPSLARDAASGLKKVRRAITGVRAQVDESLGDDFPHLRDVDFRQYHPRTFIRNQLLGDDDDLPPVRRGTGTGRAGAVHRPGTGHRAGAAAAAATVTAHAAARSRDRSTPPPFDPDAT
ncbi:twin-arginine translocase TatA/TatE family subunit [Geodermatophilus sp. YIM 151500]|uniref:twin-arginine translocase TatA/TatE family subunit n=1 Tax=Geodermatophilus sp. YIM 151500 TaxID=2984531 RepID=UPI0021E3E2BE|nr:twin-arginine translocase TatA/TatE family subunit [Geodermatophilus sp. YIM 151500]MCV2490699.1 twin-arginine translocase TatA/TatE family subunit [Geodermatophilus sp. YIM 151500]